MRTAQGGQGRGLQRADSGGCKYGADSGARGDHRSHGQPVAAADGVQADSSTRSFGVLCGRGICVWCLPREECLPPSRSPHRESALGGAGSAPDARTSHKRSYVVGSLHGRTALRGTQGAVVGARFPAQGAGRHPLRDGISRGGLQSEATGKPARCHEVDRTLAAILIIRAPEKVMPLAGHYCGGPNTF